MYLIWYYEYEFLGKTSNNFNKFFLVLAKVFANFLMELIHLIMMSET